MNQREKLIYIISAYKNNKYNTSDFCNLFVDILYHQKDGTITDEEMVSLGQFGDVFARYSPHEEDVKSGFLCNEKRVLEEFKALLNSMGIISDGE